MLERKKIALIHIVKKELGLNDPEYRRILNEAVGVSSARDLDEEKFRKLMNYFARSKYYRLNPYGLTIRQKLYIGQLTRNLDWSQEHLGNFIHKYYGKTSIDALNKKEAIKVIQALKNINEHSKGPGPA